MASILFLVLGDMTAAIIGVSFGGDALGQLRLGREGKKSLEGSLAMFTVCFVTGSSIFAEVRLREYPVSAPPRPCPCALIQNNHDGPGASARQVFIGALVATLTELYEPFKINDNLSIPLLASIAMQLAFHRIKMC
jgi:diacylglycerol kinase (CTP)